MTEPLDTQTAASAEESREARLERAIWTALDDTSNDAQAVKDVLRDALRPA